MTIDIEYYDGYSAIANARFFLGFSDRYVFDRGPMMGFLLMPSEAFRAVWPLHPLDVRPHHLSMAFIHSIYLLLVYAILVQAFGRNWPVLAAWAACVLTFMFFSYAPFLSHDLFPGAILLAMLYWREKFVRNPSLWLWAGLVILGAAAALVKQTFGIFWILVLAASVFQTLKSENGERAQTLGLLASGAVVSGLITWLVLGAILGNVDPNASLLSRPYRNLQYLARVYEGKNVVFPLWIYLRNFPAYGWLMTLLILPGWVLSIRGTRFQQSLAVAWLGGIVFLHVLPLREVRYMAFLAPVAAGLLVPAIERLKRHKLLLTAAGLVLAIDISRGVMEAAHIFEPFYRSGIQRRFFSVLDDPATRQGPVFVNSFMVNFVDPTPSSLAADRYHRIFHFGTVHLRQILDCQDLRVIADRQSAWKSALTCAEGAPLFYTNAILARAPSWRTGPPMGSEDFSQGVAVLRSDRVEVKNAVNAAASPAEAVVITSRPASAGSGEYRIEGPACRLTASGELLPVLRFESTNSAYPLERVSPTAYTILGVKNDTRLPSSQFCRLCRFEVRQQMVLQLER